MGKNNVHLLQFTFFSDYEGGIHYLAEKLAEKEQWDFSNTNKKTYSILKNYLEYTFRRLQDEKKIAYTSDNQYACFNTGLVTRYLEDIFAFFEKYKKNKPSEIEPPTYYFKGFFKKSDIIIIKNFGDNLPDTANYFEKPELLIFNPKCEIIVNIEHIINDNIVRFPEHLQKSNDKDRKRILESTIEETKKKVRTNYKIAVPQYYNRKIQLLLPLCLTSDSPNPDLALAVERLNDKVYTARTCLTLEMAYTNARLICKTESNWLKP